MHLNKQIFVTVEILRKKLHGHAQYTHENAYICVWTYAYVCGNKNSAGNKKQKCGSQFSGPLRNIVNHFLN